MVFTFGKNSVGADLSAASTVDAPFWIISKGILCIGIKHQIPPVNRSSPSKIASASPEPAIIAMKGTYLEDLFLHLF